MSYSNEVERRCRIAVSDCAGRFQLRLTPKLWSALEWIYYTGSLDRSEEGQKDFEETFELKEKP